MSDLYDDIGEITGGLEAYELELETIILNSSNEKANIYLQEALIAIRRALSGMSDALFEIATEVSDDDFEDENDGLDESGIL